MGMVMSKVVNFTIKNTIAVTITSAITFASIYFSPYLLSMSPMLGESIDVFDLRYESCT